MGNEGTEALKYVWKGAIPLQIHLHDSEVATLPPPPPVLLLAPRIGYLPLLASQIKPLFSNSLPPGEDTIWFEYKGLPLKWYIPTGVLFDLLCAEPERPWNLTVHFRGYPSNTLTPCEGEDAVKWSFINSLKEAAYIINGNCKNVMNMSQSDQLDLWRSVLNGRIPVRLYVRIFTEMFDDLEKAPEIDSWEKISYINRPVGLNKDEGKCFTLTDAMKTLLPEYFGEGTLNGEKTIEEEVQDVHPEVAGDPKITEEVTASVSERTEAKQPSESAEIKLIRIQGIKPKPEIPFSWVVNNLMNPDHYLHICVYLIHH
ncbi:autophagy protein 5-like isoform X2 [Chenopodium quinoa]|uniref:autophagy protein 5-like isoform X2 n=1 Tax=Chenopodium quinoa TaxID=63459 RepID=UPI000B78E0E7|nr:autophagy protein 5-like isoform X2 [Chenopodium quinoa]